MKFGGFNLYSFYLAVVSFVSVVAVAITLGIVLTSVGKYLIISDDEYIENRQSWKIEQCTNEMRYDSVVEKDIKVNKTPEEIAACESKARESALKARSYDLKDMFIGSFAWMVVFLMLFGFHYPKFLKLKD